MEVRRLSEMRMADMVKLWNEGFQGYFVDLTMSLEQMLKRMAAESIQPELSFALYDHGKPVGFVWNGMRIINHRLTAWNGGTAVIPELRHQGVGRELLKEALRIYEQEGVEVALLEAIAENSAAISLYEKMGYVIIDQLNNFKQVGRLPDAAFHTTSDKNISIQHTIPQDVCSLPFYDSSAPWQSQYCNISNGESIIAYNKKGDAIGYAIYRRLFRLDGEHGATVLYQCRVDEDIVSSAETSLFILREVFAPEDEIERRVVNLSSSQSELVRALEIVGFQKQVQSVHMKKMLRA